MATVQGRQDRKDGEKRCASSSVRSALRRAVVKRTKVRGAGRGHERAVWCGVLRGGKGGEGRKEGRW